MRLILAVRGAWGMAERYDAQSVEPKWRQRWEQAGIYVAGEDDPRPPYYVLTMYPYPSGDLHVGHWYPMTPTDAHARWMRMRGYNVLFPMGFDAFGLPAENAAIRNNIHPAPWTLANISRMEEQLRTMGAGFDWTREIITCLPEYYRWNQWFFLQFYKRGLAYRAFAPVDWCPKCNTTLAREQVIGTNRICERCETPVVKKELNQWRLRITQYAEELLNFEGMDWPERIQTLQRNWIGRSEGAELAFSVRASAATIRVFTTRPDTIYGVSFCVLAPEHPLVAELTSPDCRDAVQAYVGEATRRSEIERQSTERERTGVFIGAYAIHPFTGAEVPIYIADYVLMGYGTGAIMGVPAHDERDFDFARRHRLEIPVVIAPPDWDGEPLTAPYLGDGLMVNSGPFSGRPAVEGKAAVSAALADRGIGGPAVTYRLRDWLISRQRMWGTPIPMIHCPACGVVPVPESDLPVTLPEIVEFRPTGESPLKSHEAFLRVTCPACGGAAERDTDTMDTFIDSSWYQTRYLSPHNSEVPFDAEAAARWLPPGLYTGGAEHAVMHLLYSRFFHKVMRDMGLFDAARRLHPDRNWDEPFPRLFNQGVITAMTYRDPAGRVTPYAQISFDTDPPTVAATGEPLVESIEKMSKSKGNVVAPDDYVRRYGADVVRVFLMFIGPWELGGPWNPRAVDGVVRFVNRVWTLVSDSAAAATAPGTAEDRELRRAVHQTLRKVTSDHERFSFNTMISALMELTNTCYRLRAACLGTPAWGEAMRTLTLMLAPVAPHLAEELWAVLGGEFSVHVQTWPRWDDALAADDTIEIVVQVNGKVRDRLTVPADASEEHVTGLATSAEKVRAAIGTAAIRKLIYVPGRLINIVAG